MKKITGAVLTFLLVLSVFAGCGASYDSTIAASSMAEAAAPQAALAAEAPRNAGFGGFAEGAVMEEAVAEDAAYEEAPASGTPVMPPDAGGIAGPTVEQDTSERKIIKNADLEIQTMDFENSVSYIEKAVEGFGGFVQNSYVQGFDMFRERGARSATFSIRVPSESLDAFINSFGGERFNVISKSQYSDDITEQYYDSRARLDALRVQEERLIEMLETAAELEYLLQVEEKLMNVRYEIESITSQLNRMDSSVRLSTVNISLYEVVEYEDVNDVPVTFGDRIARAFYNAIENFADFMQELVVLIVALFPFLILVGIIVIVIVLGIRRAGKKRAEKRIDYQNQQIAKFMAQQPDTQKQEAPPEHAQGENTGEGGH